MDSRPVKKRRTSTVTATLWLVLGWTLPAGAQVADADRYWGQWRGPEANGVARHADPPLTWSETEHVAWKVEVPGRGSASPIVWGDKVFLLTAVPFGESVTLEAPDVPQGQAQPGRGVVPVAGVAAVGHGDRKRCRRIGSWCWPSTARPATSCGSG